MKLLFSIQSLAFGKGGTERVAAEVANEMSNRGHEVYVYYNSLPGDLPQYTLNKAIQHVQIPFNKWSASKIRKTITDIDPDIFFVFYFNINLLLQYGMIATTNIPIGVHEGTNPVRAIKNIFHNKKILDIETAFSIRKAFLSGMHGIRFTMEKYKHSLPAIARPYCSTYFNTFCPARCKAEVSKYSDKAIIINVGGLKTHNKNGIVLLKAFTNIAHDFPDWDLKFLGRAEPEIFKEANKIINENKLNHRIHIHEETTDIYSEYEKSQLHVICSFEEGCPNVVCEAMLHGLPSIGFSDCPGTNELIIDNENGLLINREPEIENLRKALRKLMSDHKLRQQLSNKAYEEAGEKFDKITIYDQWEQLLKNIASYKGSVERLFEEQCAIDPSTTKKMRNLRTHYLQKYGTGYFKSNDHVTNEKINL